MCGFAGVVVWDDRLSVSRDTLSLMSARIVHRGPDGEGIWINNPVPASRDQPQIGLVHRRLAIIDLDPRSNQPFEDGQGRCLAFNGEIYNFRELRAELERLQPTYRWRTSGDTEVLLAAYAQWGGDCVRHLEGMFAFAIWDRANKSLLLARDRMGQKPLYVARPEDDASAGSLSAIAFASEIGALRSIPWVSGECDELALVEYLSWGQVSSARSIYKRVDQLAPGSIRVAVDGKTSPDLPYWPEAGSMAVSDSPIATTRDLVTRAVRSQLVADVPVGCFLSGGVDSSVIVAAMKSALPTGQRPLTFCIGFDDPRYDEREFAAKVAGHLGTEHHEFVVRPDAAADLSKIAAAFGEPFGDSSALPTYYLSRETRKHVKVALSGDGGDELFGGYDRYRAMVLGQQLRTAITPLPWMALGPILRQFPGGHSKSRWERARRFAASLHLAPAHRYASYRRLFDGSLLRRLFHPDLSPALFKFDRVVASFASGDTFRAAMASDRMLYLPDDLLTKVDRCSMRFALEVRSPFMDPHVVQLAAGLTRAELVAGGPKRMLREAFAGDLPDWVFRRPKMGFAVPIGQWLRDELRDTLHDHLFANDSFASRHFAPWVVERLINEHAIARADHSQRLYALLMLELWWRQSRDPGPSPFAGKVS